MSAEQLPGQSSLEQPCEPPKRRRTPSEYATRIAELKSNYSFPDKKNKSCKQLENLEAPQPAAKQASARPLICVLPSGKKYSLKIEVESIKSSKIDRAAKKKSKVLNQSPPPAVKCKQDKQKDENQTFFDKFLLVVEQLQKKDEHESKEINEASKQNLESRLSRRDEKIRRQREREQKWSKSYERMRSLSERLDRLVSNLTFLN